MPRSFAEIEHDILEGDAMVHSGWWRKADGLAEAIDTLGMSPVTLVQTAGCSKAHVMRLARLSRTYSADHRPVTLTQGHFVAALSSPAPEEWIEAAAEREWSIAQLADEIAGLADSPRVELGETAQLARSAERLVAKARKAGASEASVSIKVGGEEVERKWSA